MAVTSKVAVEIDGIIVRDEAKRSRNFVSMPERKELLSVTKANAVLLFMYYAEEKYREEADFADDRVAEQMGLATVTVRNLRLELSRLGFISQRKLKGMKFWFVGKHAVMFNRVFPTKKLDNYPAWKKLCTEFKQQLAIADKSNDPIAATREVYLKMQEAFENDPEKYS